MERHFEVVISSCENSIWQGTLRTEGETLNFRSGLELMLELARLLPPAEAEQPRWEIGGDGR